MALRHFYSQMSQNFKSRDLGDHAQGNLRLKIVSKKIVEEQLVRTICDAWRSTFLYKHYGTELPSLKCQNKIALVIKRIVHWWRCTSHSLLCKTNAPPQFRWRQSPACDFPTIWPSRCPNLNLPSYLLWGCLKPMVSHDLITSVSELKE